MSAKYTTLYVILGVVLWAVMGFIIREYGDFLFNHGIFHNAIFAGTPFAGGVMIWIASLLSRVPMRLMLPPAAVMSFIALLGHAVCLTWMPGIYGVDGVILGQASAWIMWACGSLLMMGVVAFRLSAEE